MIYIDTKKIVYKNYEDFGIVYNLEIGNIISVQDVALDIIDYIFNRKEPINVDDVIGYICELYNEDYQIITKDTKDFIISLIYNGIVIDTEDRIIFDSSRVFNEENSRDLENEVIEILAERNQIFSATIELTYLCNEKCLHCYATNCDDESNYVLDVNKCKLIIDELKEMNCCQINFTGGDPFMFIGFLDVFKYARENNFVCCIYTNAQAMYENERIVTEIAEYYPKTVYISLYGADALTHESVTRVKGSFDKTVSVAKRLTELNVFVVFQIMVLKTNSNHVKEMIALAKSLNVDYRVGLSIINKNNGDRTPQEYAETNSDTIKSVMMYSSENFVSMDKRNKMYKKDLNSVMCGAGQTTLCISPNGNVYPCVSLKVCFGNVFSQSIKEIWKGEKRRQLLNQLTWLNTEKCTECKYIDFCPHCVGISLLESGNMLSCNVCDYTLAKCAFELFC